MSRPTRLTRLGLAYYLVLAAAVAVGLVIGGGTGQIIVGIAVVIFALTMFAAFGGGRPSVYRDGRRYGTSAEEDRERRYRR